MGSRLEQPKARRQRNILVGCTSMPPQNTETPPLSTSTISAILGGADHFALDIVRFLFTSLQYRATTQFVSYCCCGMFCSSSLGLTHQVAHHREQVNRGPLVSDFVDADLRVGYTTAVPRLDEGLVLLEAVATSRSCGSGIGSRSSDPSVHPSIHPFPKRGRPYTRQYHTGHADKDTKQARCGNQRRVRTS